MIRALLLVALAASGFGIGFALERLTHFVRDEGKTVVTVSGATTLLPPGASRRGRDLQPGTSIEGRFLNLGDQQLRYRGPRPDQWWQTVHFGRDTLGTPARNGGTFRLYDLAPGRHRFQAVRGFLPPTVEKEWHVDVHPGGQQLTLNGRDGVETVGQFRAVTTSGAPVLGIQRVRVDVKRYSFQSSTGFQRHRDSLRSHVHVHSLGDGLYLFPFEPGQHRALVGRQATSVSLSVSCGEGAGESVIEPAEWRDEHVVEVAAHGAIDVEIVDYIGSGFEGQLHVTVQRPNELGGRVGRLPTRLSAIGAIRAQRIPPGRYRVRAHSYQRGKQHEFFDQTIEVDGDEQRLTVSLDPLRALLSQQEEQPRGTEK